MLGELLGHMEGAEEIAGEIAHRYPGYEAMAEAVRKAADMVTVACEAEAYGERDGDD
jgi:hypothetical protein